MISTDPTNKIDLRTRTRQRSESIWVGLLAGTPLAADEEQFNVLYQAEVESYLALSDEVFEVKEYERDQKAIQAQAEVDQNRQVATEKADTERQRIALKIAADNVLYAARVYDAQVRGLIMAAREYAGQVEVAQLGAEAAKYQLGVEKEAVHAQEIGVKIEIEGIQRAMVQADLAKEKLEVAKAGVRALMADIGAEEAGLKALEAQIQVAITQAEAASLEADVAMIFAEAVTKQISAITLGVESAGIGQGFSIVAQHLADILALWDQKISTEKSREASAQKILDAIVTLANLEVDGAKIVVAEAKSAQSVADAEAETAHNAIMLEAPYLLQEVDGRLSVSSAESANRIALAEKRGAMQILVNAARAAIYANKTLIRSNLHQDYLWIQKG